MSSIALSAYCSNAAWSAAELVPSLLLDAVTLKDTLSFCRYCRIRGIGGLLLDGIAEPLHRELCRSGHALRHALPRIPEDEKATGTLFPFFDAIAAGDRECAHAIATLGRTTWNPEEEYEDDFLYIRFLMMHLFIGADPATCESLLQQWSTLLDGAHDARLDLCRALFARASPGFETALLSLLEEEKARYRRLSRAGALAAEIEATEANLSVEGIALVRLARASGLTTRANYWGVPSIALTNPSAALYEAAWQTL